MTDLSMNTHIKNKNKNLRVNLIAGIINMGLFNAS